VSRAHLWSRATNGETIAGRRSGAAGLISLAGFPLACRVLISFRMNRYAGFVVAGLALLNAGCAAEAQTHAYVAGPDVVAFYEPPPLIMVEPGIYVLRDSAVPVYYIDGAYWSYSDGVWYRAGHWRDPWVRVGIHGIPYGIAHRDHHRYVRYHGHPHSYVYREPGQPRRDHYRGPARPQRAERSYRPAQPSIERHPAPAPARIEGVPSPAPSRIERAPSSPQRIERNSRPAQPKVEPRRSAPPKADTRRRPR
jgi:hypothetical protein